MWGPGRRTPVTVRRWAVGLIVGALVAGACSGGGDDRVTGPTIPTDTSRATTTTSTTTTLAPASYDVPEVIDQAYVQRVVSAYDKVLGDAIRVLKRDGGVSDEFLKHLLAIYTAEEFEFQQDLWRESLAKGRLEKTPSSPGDPVTTVIGISRSEPTCVIARAERDLAANFEGDQAESEQDDYVVLVPKPGGRDPLGLNPTPWVLHFDGFNVDNSEPVEKCS